MCTTAMSECTRGGGVHGVMGGRVPGVVVVRTLVVHCGTPPGGGCGCIYSL